MTAESVVKTGPLTVRQVIEALSRFDPELDVMVEGPGAHLCPSTEVELYYEPERFGGGEACVAIR